MDDMLEFIDVFLEEPIVDYIRPGCLLVNIFSPSGCLASELTTLGIFRADDMEEIFIDRVYGTTEVYIPVDKLVSL